MKLIDRILERIPYYQDGSIGTSAMVLTSKVVYIGGDLKEIGHGDCRLWTGKKNSCGKHRLFL
jgi:hypothetical protein